MAIVVQIEVSISACLISNVTTTSSFLAFPPVEIVKDQVFCIQAPFRAREIAGSSLCSKHGRQKLPLYCIIRVNTSNQCNDL